jgi:hypothetical protein
MNKPRHRKIEVIIAEGRIGSIDEMAASDSV